MTHTTLAASTDENTTIEYLDNGNYIITLIEDESPLLSSTIVPSTTKKTVTKSKTTNYYNSKHELMWYVKVTGTFTYDKKTATCTSSIVTSTSKHSSWKIQEKSSSKSNATAIGKASATHYAADNHIIETIRKTVKLTCSPNGSFS